MAAPIDNTGTQRALIMKQGADFGPIELRVKKADGTPFVLTGATLRGQIRKKALDASVVKSFQFAITDAVNGVCTMAMPSADTAAIACGESPNDDASRYVYDVEAEIAGMVTSLLWGSVTMVREVTR